MSIIKLQLQDNKKTIINLTSPKIQITNYIHIKKIWFLRDILITNGNEYKYNSRAKLLEDIELLKCLSELLNRQTLLRFDSYKKYDPVLVKDFVLQDSKEYMHPLERRYNKVLKKECTVIRSRFSLENILLYNNDKTYRKKLSIVRDIVKCEFIWVTNKNDVEALKIVLKDILKYKD